MRAIQPPRRRRAGTTAAAAALALLCRTPPPRDAGFELGKLRYQYQLPAPVVIICPTCCQPGDLIEVHQDGRRLACGHTLGGNPA